MKNFKYVGGGGMSLAVGPKISSSEMQPIKSWEDIKPFAGGFVAYKTDSYYFGARRGHTFDSDKTTYFGYIDNNVVEWDTGEKGYNITRLLKPKEIGGACALIASRLTYPISMRAATENEMKKIVIACKTGCAEFESGIVADFLKCKL